MTDRKSLKENNVNGAKVISLYNEDGTRHIYATSITWDWNKEKPSHSWSISYNKVDTDFKIGESITSENGVEIPKYLMKKKDVVAFIKSLNVGFNI